MRPALRRSLLAVVCLFALVLGACADDGELGGPSVGGTLAAKIGSFDYTNADLENEVELWASNPALLGLLQIADLGRQGQRSADLVTFVLSNRIISEQARQIGIAQGYQPTGDDVDEVLAQIDANFIDPSTGVAVFALFPEDFRRQLGSDLAFQSQLSSFDPSQAVVPEVAVNPRYGTVRLDGLGFAQVDPPEGPRPAPVLRPAAEGSLGE